MKSNTLEIALEKVNIEFRKIKKLLHEVAVKENMIATYSKKIEQLASANTFEELLIILKTETQQYNKSKRSLTFLKYMLIVFESFSGYLTIGLITHNLTLSENPLISFLSKWLIAVLVSYGFIDVPLKHVKYSIVSYLFIPIFPIANILAIYFSDIEIDNKEIYLISSFITLFSAIGLLLLTKKASLKDQSNAISNEIMNNLKDRKTLLDAAEKHYNNIYRINNEEFGFLDDPKNIPEHNPLFKELKKFFNDCENFDNWSYTYIEEIKQMLKKSNLNP